MGIWITIALEYLICPVLMTASGYLMQKHPPREINGLYGYRTARSSKSQEAWDFSQRYSAKLYVKWGRILTAVSLLLFLVLMGLGAETAGIAGTFVCLVQIVFLILPIPFVERALKENFDQNGNPTA